MTEQPPLILHVFPTFATGGAQVRFATLANHFGRRLRHLVIAMDGVQTCRKRLRDDIDIEFPILDIRKGDTLGNLRRFRRFLRNRRPSLLVTSNWGSIEWAIANAVPVVRHVHMEDGFGPEERERQIARRVWTRRLFLARSTVMLPSRTLLRIATETWRLNPGRLRYIPNGIDLDRFRPAERAEADRSGREPVIGTVAALRAEKNVGRLLRAFRLAAGDAPARLVVVGDGPERGALEALAQEPGLAGRVHFTGHVDAPHCMYEDFDLFALSSDTEQMPLSVLEAMAAGLPVASTDVGDVRFMVARENTAFLSSCDDTALAEVIRPLLQDAGVRQRIGTANRAKAEREYDEQTMFHAWGGLLQASPSSSAEH